MNSFVTTPTSPASSSLSPAEWQLQDAKNRLSQVVRAARAGVPQWVTVHGKRAAVVVSAEQYEQLTDEQGASRRTSAAKQAGQSLVEALKMDWPEGGLTDEELNGYFGRDRSLDAARELNL